jgi:phosphoribosylformimino-5-aminoimidazole carboxamide ribotide isomerase
VRVIGVIDLMAGRAVHARGGKRDAYEPVHSPLLSPEQVGNAAALARAYSGLVGVAEIYVADLDAIGGAPRPQDLREIIASGLPVMVDAGITTARAAERVTTGGATRVVVGLETLASFDDLARIVEHIGAPRVVFGLDLRDGRPLTRPGTPFDRVPPPELAHRALCAGAQAILLLDVARVGRAAGADLDLVKTLRGEFPACELLVGGGGRVSDLEQLEAHGCDAALVGTALHGGLQLSRFVERHAAADPDRPRPPPAAG